MTGRLQRRLATILFAAAPAAAFAGGPEQLDQLEPGKGEWQAEYFGTFGKGARDHAIEAMFGIGERLALGFEIETEYDGDLAFDTAGPKALYRLTGPGAPIALGVQVQLGFDKHAHLAEAEARLIAEAQTENWWAQGNAMLQRASDDGLASTGLAYGWSLQHAVGDFAWLGAEASGQTAPLWRDTGADEEHGHFIGPSLSFDWEPAPDREVEIGFAWLHRVSGDGPRQSGRFFAQLSF